MRGIKSDSLGFGSKSKLYIKSDRRGLRRARGGGGGGGKKVALGFRESSKAKYCMKLFGVFKKLKVKCRPDPTLL
jgi:hypothetical protein